MKMDEYKFRLILTAVVWIVALLALVILVAVGAEGKSPELFGALMTALGITSPAILYELRNVGREKRRLSEAPIARATTEAPAQSLPPPAGDEA